MHTSTVKPFDIVQLVSACGILYFFYFGILFMKCYVIVEILFSSSLCCGGLFSVSVVCI